MELKLAHQQPESCRVAKRVRTLMKQDALQGPPRLVLRPCMVPINDTVETPYLHFAEKVKRMGAWKAVLSTCGGGCACGNCSPAREREHSPESDECGARDHERERRMFDRRVAANPKKMQIMYGDFLK